MLSLDLHDINIDRRCKAFARVLSRDWDFTFNNQHLLQLALTHRSVAVIKNHSTHPHNVLVPSNERLEFLGDRVLGLVVAHHLYQTYSAAQEGSLALHQSILISREQCTQIAKMLNLGSYLDVADPKLRDQSSVLANAVEALIGAIFLDDNGGWQHAETIVQRWWHNHWQNAPSHQIDTKTRLQNYALSQQWSLPIYVLIDQGGPPHKPLFTIEARITSHNHHAQGKGKSKQAAEKEAAHNLYHKLHSS